MEYRLLGRSGLKVSALSMGTWTFGNNSPDKPTGSVGLKDARRQMDMLLDAGVNLIDTANVYSRGQSADVREGVMSFLEKRPAKFTQTVSQDMPSYFPWWDERPYE